MSSRFSSIELAQLHTEFVLSGVAITDQLASTSIEVLDGEIDISNCIVEPLDSKPVVTQADLLVVEEEGTLNRKTREGSGTVLMRQLKHAEEQIDGVSSSPKLPGKAQPSALKRDSLNNKARLKEEQAKKERLLAEKERAERAKSEKLKLEKERLEKERLEKERLEKERLERERLERERLEQERLEQERCAEEEASAQ